MAGKPPLRVVLNRSDGSREEIDASGISGVLWTPRFRDLPGAQQVRGGVLQVRLEYELEPGREWMRFDTTRTRDPVHGVVWGELATSLDGVLGHDPTTSADHRYAPCFSHWPVNGPPGTPPPNEGSFLAGETLWCPAAVKREAPAKPRARTAPKSQPAASASPQPATGAPADAAPTKKAPARKTAAARAPVKKAPAKKAAAGKAPAKKPAAKKPAAKKAPAKKAGAAKGVARKAPAKKAGAAKGVARKAPAKKAAGRKAPAK